ncbi:hypothetical protein EIP91_001142 [Steccherinum ochraceum]|uniref:Uncharacterized protein n=1 Tax=Steccherinum ochraceum TaxID=92696 RepID=A0A4R0RKW2_9APHY|nr:hypothetical protein EIP91_001142 [Steccherinum ochraceum]
MATPIDSSAHAHHAHFFASGGVPTSVGLNVAGSGYYPAFPSSYYPVGFRDMFPAMRSRFDSFGYSGFIPEGTFKVEEARLHALKEWSALNAKREAEHLTLESTLEKHILSRAASEVEFAKNSLSLLELQRQLFELQVAKAKDTTLDKLVVRKAQADAERAEAEKQITVTLLAKKAQAEAERAEAEVAWVKCQHKKTEKEKAKLDLEMHLVQAQVESFKAQTAKFQAEAAKANAEAQLAAAASTPAPSSGAAPAQQEVKQLLDKLEKMDPCSGGYAWVDRPDEGGFRCEGGSHFKSYAEARAFVAAKKK